MILVHLIRTWPAVQAGEMSADDSTLGEWAQLSEQNIAEYGDVLVGIYDNTIVSIYAIDGHYRDRETKRVTFKGQQTDEWNAYIGRDNPGRQWGDQGYARTVQVLPTEDLVDPKLESDDETLTKPAPWVYRAPTAKLRGAWVSKLPGGINFTVWDDGMVKVGRWDHRMTLVDSKPRNYGAGKSRGGCLIRMTFEPLAGETT